MYVNNAHHAIILYHSFQWKSKYVINSRKKKVNILLVFYLFLKLFQVTSWSRSQNVFFFSWIVVWDLSFDFFYNRFFLVGFIIDF